MTGIPQKVGTHLSGFGATAVTGAVHSPMAWLAPLVWAIITLSSSSATSIALASAAIPI